MSAHQKNIKQQLSISFIKYHPELKRFFGSEATVLILQQLEYWSARYPSGFWKFFEPCDHHPQYREGDSWAEELGFSRRVFLRAFAIIGTHYKSKSEYLKQADPFQGKMYASYYDRKTNRTHFFRDHGSIDRFLKSFWEKAKKISKVVKEKVVKHCVNKSFDSRSGNDQNGRSFVRALDISLQRSTSPHNVIKSDLPLLPCPDVLDPNVSQTRDERDNNLDIAQNMLDIWNNITSNKQPLRSDFKLNLPKTLQKSFQGSLERWTEFCKTVASSKFLMGEAPNSKFKAHLAWLIKPDTIQAIAENHYSLGDREVRYTQSFSQPQNTFNRDDIQGTESWKEICTQLCHQLGYATFKSWFKDLNLVSEETSRPVLQCPNRFMRDWITSQYHRDVETIVRQVLPHTTHLVLECA